MNSATPSALRTSRIAPTPRSWCDEEQGSDGDTMVGGWDLDSVMNYCNPDWNGDGNLSSGDIAGIQQFYPFSATAQVLGDGSGVHTHSALTGDVNGDGRMDNRLRRTELERRWPQYPN